MRKFWPMASGCQAGDGIRRAGRRKRTRDMRFFGPSIPIWLLIALLLSSCSSDNAPQSTPIYGFRPSRAEFNLGDVARFEFNIRRIASDGRQHLLIVYAKYARASGDKLGSF